MSGRTALSASGSHHSHAVGYLWNQARLAAGLAQVGIAQDAVQALHRFG